MIDEPYDFQSVMHYKPVTSSSDPSKHSMTYKGTSEKIRLNAHKYPDGASKWFRRGSSGDMTQVEHFLFSQKQTEILFSSWPKYTRIFVNRLLKNDATLLIMLVTIFTWRIEGATESLIAMICQMKLTVVHQSGFMSLVSKILIY